MVPNSERTPLSRQDRGDLRLKVIHQKSLILHANGMPHVLFTRLSKYLSLNKSPKTLRIYGSHWVRFVNHLARQQNRHEADWQLDKLALRIAVKRYLIEELRCYLRHARFDPNAFLIYAGPIKMTTVSSHLAAIRSFYQGLYELGEYPQKKPLSLLKVAQPKNPNANPPEYPIPLCSEVRRAQVDSATDHQSNNYLVCIKNKWQPKTIDSPDFPFQVWQAGRKFDWRLREQFIVRLLFESGARISEICALRVKDWIDLGGKSQAYALNKGSFGERSKVLMWSSDTTRLLQQYWRRERVKVVPNQPNLSKLYNGQITDALLEQPLLLNRLHRAVTPHSFRTLYWHPALKAEGINATPHQCRHWFVTRHIRQIYEAAGTQQIDHPQVRPQLQALISYMQWRSGWSVIEAYNHYFEQSSIVLMQESLHQSLKTELTNPSTSTRAKPAISPEVDPLLQQVYAQVSLS